MLQKSRCSPSSLNRLDPGDLSRVPSQLFVPFFEISCTFRRHAPFCSFLLCTCSSTLEMAFCLFIGGKPRLKEVEKFVLEFSHSTPGAQPVSFLRYHTHSRLTAPPCRWPPTFVIFYPPILSRPTWSYYKAVSLDFFFFKARMLILSVYFRTSVDFKKVTWGDPTPFPAMLLTSFTAFLELLWNG